MKVWLLSILPKQDWLKFQITLHIEPSSAVEANSFTEVRKKRQKAYRALKGDIFYPSISLIYSKFSTSMNPRDHAHPLMKRFRSNYLLPHSLPTWKRASICLLELSRRSPLWQILTTPKALKISNWVANWPAPQFQQSDIQLSPAVSGLQFRFDEALAWTSREPTIPSTHPLDRNGQDGGKLACTPFSESWTHKRSVFRRISEKQPLIWWKFFHF